MPEQTPYTPRLFWLTGLSGAGKTTLAEALAVRLRALGGSVVVLDGDTLRQRLCHDLGFSEADRRENIRRAGKAAVAGLQTGKSVIVALISPYRIAREAVRMQVAAGDFIEIHVDCPLEECERRDPKGLYRHARTGDLRGLTGIDAPYEAPEHPEVYVNMSELTVEAAVAKILRVALDP